MNEATLEYLEGIAETDVQKRMIKIFSEKTYSDEDFDTVLKEILNYIKEAKN